jgi:hypothetical protein
MVEGVLTKLTGHNLKFLKAKALDSTDRIPLKA